MGRIVVAALLLVLGACSTIPADPDDTLERVTGDTLRAGVSANPPWTELPEGAGSGSDGAGGESEAAEREATGGGREPEGVEVELVADFAASLGAEVEWVTGGEERLIGQLAAGELHVVIGGLTADSPWQEMVALTRPYREADDDGGGDGEQVQRVMATPAGENAFLAALEQFLGEQSLTEQSVGERGPAEQTLAEQSLAGEQSLGGQGLAQQSTPEQSLPEQSQEP